MADYVMENIGNNLEQLVQSAQEATRKEDWPEAISRWQKVIDKFDKKAPAEAWLWLTKGYVNEKKLDKAELIISEGLKKRPNKSKLLVLAGKISTTREDWRLAKQRWGKVIELLGDKSPIVAWANLAEAQRMLDQLEKAEKTAQTGLAKHGGNREILIELAEIATAKKDWRTAFNFWGDALRSINKQTRPNIPIKQHARFNASILKRLVNIDNYKEAIKKYSSSKTKRKIAIVTSFTKGYDVLKPPERLDYRLDYIVYTDDKPGSLGIFDIRPLPKPELDAGRAIRFVKTHPHTLLSDYDVVVWMDASLMIVGDIYPLIEEFKNSNKAIGSGVHPLRKNIYDEFKVNVDLKKENYNIMKKQIDFYRSKGFQHSDLTENTLLMFNLKHKKLAPTLETWWEQIMRFSKRDQLSFNYSLSKNGVDWSRLTKPPHDIRNHPTFVMTAHHFKPPILAELIRALKQD